MAASLNIHSDGTNSSTSNERFVVADVALDNSYPTGGYPIAASGALQLEQIDAVIVGGDMSGYVFSYNYATGNLQVFQQTTVAGPLIEVPNLTNLSGVNVRLAFFGY